MAKADRQLAVPGSEAQAPSSRQKLRISMLDKEIGTYVGFHDRKNVFVDLCDRCHRPGICVKNRWYHEQPMDRPCTVENAPRPALEAQTRLLRWYQWCQAQARKVSFAEVERAKALENLVHPMTNYLLDQISRPDRRSLPTVSECRMIQQAMARTAWDSDIDPIEIEEWTAKSTS